MGSKEKSGTITVFASLSLMLVASFLLALLEAARARGFEAYSAMHRANAMETVFSEYQRDLFEKYGVFMLDGGYGTDGLQISQIDARLLSASQRNLRPAGRLRRRQNFYQMDVEEASMREYLLATDYDGEPFRHMAAESMKLRCPEEIARELYEGFKSAGDAADVGRQNQSAVDDALENIESAKNARAEAAREAAENGGEPPPAPSGPPVENPMDIVKSAKKRDILSLVKPSDAVISEKSLGDYDKLERRTLSGGVGDWDVSGDWYETVLYHQFLESEFSCFTSSASGDGALDYELEYIHAGKKSDRDNLKSVVKEMLAMREGANLLYLEGDPEKTAEAHALALAIAASFGIAPAEELVAQGILAAWAFVESVLDLRTLLSGGKIPWMKTAESWTSALSGIGSLLSGGMRAKEDPGGEDYPGYLQKLLYLSSARKLNYRAMDVMELYAARHGHGQLRMDNMILAMRADFSFVAKPIFSGLVTLRHPDIDRLVYAKTEEYGYLEK